MHRHSFAHTLPGLLVAVAACLHFAAAAQDAPKKPPRRLPPTGSQTSAIPEGVDTGSPATSNAMQLGTPVPPAAGADRGDQNKRSAAARAAARPASTAASGAASAPVFVTKKKP
jgi:hypothetical protein